MINNPLLQSVSTHIKDTIVAVRLNSVAVQTVFVSKTSTTDQMVVEFNVPESIKRLTKLEFLGSKNEILTTVTPAEALDTTNDTRMKYTIFVRRGAKVK